MYNGYRSDMTRTVAVGQISERQRAVYETVLNAQSMALEAIEPGEYAVILMQLREIISTTADTAVASGTVSGHSVGVEIHENPSFNTRCDTVFTARNGNDCRARNISSKEFRGSY